MGFDQRASHAWLHPHIEQPIATISLRTFVASIGNS